MPRPVDGWPALGAVLHRVLAGPAVDYLAPDTRHAAEVLLRRLRRDVLRAIESLVSDNQLSLDDGYIGVQ